MAKIIKAKKPTKKTDAFESLVLLLKTNSLTFVESWKLEEEGARPYLRIGTYFRYPNGKLIEIWIAPLAKKMMEVTDKGYVLQACTENLVDPSLSEEILERIGSVCLEYNVHLTVEDALETEFEVTNQEGTERYLSMTLCDFIQASLHVTQILEHEYR